MNPSFHQHLSQRQLSSSPFTEGNKLSKENLWMLQRLSLLHTLDSHRGCVNSVVWNDSGTTILSGSDDHRLIVTNPYSKKVLMDIHTAHRANIFSAKFLPATGDSKIVSCAGDGLILYTDIERSEATRNCFFSCHNGTSYELLTVPGDPNTFLSCGEDGTVRWFDLRLKETCEKSNCKEDILISTGGFSVTSLSLNPLLPYHLAVGASDSTVRIFDRRMLSTFCLSQTKPKSLEGLLARFSVPELEGRNRRITSVQYRPDGEEILASYSSDYIYVFNPNIPDGNRIKKLFVGQANRRTGKSDKKRDGKSPPPLKKLRLRGDWSDTGPNARPEREASSSPQASPSTAPSTSRAERPAATATPSSPTRINVRPISQEQHRENVHGHLMQRMTEALSRMLNDPSTQLAMRNLHASRESRLQAANASQSQEQEAESQNDPQVVVEQGTVEPETPTDNSSQNPEASNPSVQQPTMDDRLHSQACGESPQQVDNDHEKPKNAPAHSETPVQGEKSPNPPQVAHSGSSRDESTTASGSNKPDDVDEITNAGDDSNDLEAATNDEINPAPEDIPESFPERNQSEPNVRLRYGDRGLDSSTISFSQASSSSDQVTLNTTVDATTSEVDEPLPGPSQVVTHPGNSGQNPITGQRERRRGVSGPPTGPSMDSPPTQRRLRDEDLVEYEMEEIDEDQETCGDREILQPELRQRLTGHRNARTMIKEASWWGNDFILSGSDCGHVFGWDRKTGEMVLLLEADRHVVNCVRPNPFEPTLATSGIDYNIKLWAPTKEDVDFNKEAAKQLVERNEVMLEETRDTITVPATLMIRMLASLNQIRRAGRLFPRASEEEGESRQQENQNQSEPSAQDEEQE